MLTTNPRFKFTISQIRKGGDKKLGKIIPMDEPDMELLIFVLYKRRERERLCHVVQIVICRCRKPDSKTSLHSILLAVVFLSGVRK